MIRRLFTAHLAALLALTSAAPVLADGPVGGSHTYRPAPRIVRPARPVAVAPMSAPAPEQVLSIDLTAGAGARVLDLPLGKSAIIELPVDVRDMLVTNPLVADAVLRSPRRIYVLGLASGSTDAVFFDTAGRKILQLNIRVAQDISLLSTTLRNVLPGGTVQVVPLKDSVILSGMVMNAADSEKASRIAAQFVSSPEKVLNMLSIAGKDQVMLEVRIVEVQRNIIKQLGVDLNAVLGQLGEAQYSFGLSPTFGVNGSLLGGVTSGYSTDTTKQPVLQVPCNVALPDAAKCLQVVRDNSVYGNGDTATIADTAGSAGLNKAKGMIQAFERVGLIRTLAEPNLTVLSGESGKFLAGGEFPVPTGQDVTGKVTIEFKPYGVGLGYTPVVLSGGRISLKLSTEVSELSSLGAYSVSSGAGSRTLTVPGLTVRRAETTVELPSGGSLMIAGLLQQTTKETIDAIPGMTNMPVLGALFRSRDYLNGETELVIIITPYIVDPTRPQNLQTPADGLRFASDMSTALLGRLNKVVNAPVGANTGRAYQGPVGYVIE
ncbi:type II and III secretion system protein family protein [Caulobacter sp. DWR1-3-2b1]|uniref:type II and III secretion system protein family protein n=1 Tax=Caulobacter sp. DWR1-3-2b1 TaxID=2804670 RepID=UPI003CF973A6